MSYHNVNNLYRTTEERLEEVTSQLLLAAAPGENGIVDIHSFQQRIQNAIQVLNSLDLEADVQATSEAVQEEHTINDHLSADDAISEETIELERTTRSEEHVQERRHFTQHIPTNVTHDMQAFLDFIEEARQRRFDTQGQVQIPSAEDDQTHQVTGRQNASGTFERTILRGYRLLVRFLFPIRGYLSTRGTEVPVVKCKDWIMVLFWYLSLCTTMSGHFWCMLDSRQS